MSKLFTDFEMTKDEYNSFEEWLKQHDKEVIEDYIDKVAEKLEEITDNYVRYIPPMNDYECGFEAGVEVMAKNAIEIVNAGGKNEDN